MSRITEQMPGEESQSTGAGPGRGPDIGSLAVDSECSGNDAEGFLALKRKIQAERGFQCHFYKDKCVHRRLSLRMRTRGISDYRAYATLLDRDPSEYDRLIQVLTVNVTKFFRDASMWEALRVDVVPQLMSRKRPVRAWSAGCASGEEAYSLAILLRDHAEVTGMEVEEQQIRITGTDIDFRSIERACAGRYSEIAFGEMPDRLRSRWFSSSAPSRLIDEARHGVEFRHADVMEGVEERGLDLILCRNLIIYLERSIQKNLFELFHRSLAPDGILVLGRVETLIGKSRGLFAPMNIRERIYRRKSLAG